MPYNVKLNYFSFVYQNGRLQAWTYHQASVDFEKVSIWYDLDIVILIIIHFGLYVLYTYIKYNDTLRWISGILLKTQVKKHIQNIYIICSSLYRDYFIYA